MDIVKLINPADSPRPFHYVHQDQVIDLAPGESRVVDFDVCTAAFGHPKEQDFPNARNRTENFNRIRAQWGYQLGQPYAEEQWEQELRPCYRVETLEGEWIPMILDDPLGVKSLPDSLGGRKEIIPQDPSVVLLRETIAQQQASIDQLSGMLQTLLAAQNQAATPTPAGAVSQSDTELPPVVASTMTEDAPAAPAIAETVVGGAVDPAPADIPAPTVTIRGGK